MNNASLLATATFGIFAATFPALAQQSGSQTRTVFDRFSSAVLEVHAVDTASAAKTVKGTGFHVSARLVVTNYHVVSPIVLAPDRHALRLVRDEVEVPAVLIAIDAVRDLAVLEATEPTSDVLSLRVADPPQGETAFAFGFPSDLGITIVEGTFNGLLEHSLHPRIHFTGSLNPGMSGGPTVTLDGELVGVNVATAGNQLSFLVPADRVAALIAEVQKPEYVQPLDFSDVLRRQIHEHQDNYLSTLLSTPFPTVRLGIFEVPSRLAPFFDCWGETSEDDAGFRLLDHQCSADDVIFVSDTYDGGIVRLYHRVLESQDANPFRFSRAYTEHFQTNAFWSGGDEDDVTPYRCHDGKVANDTRVLLTVFCARRLKRLSGLYDVMLRAAALGTAGTGLETTLQLTAVSFANAQRAARRFLESIRWTR